MIHPIKIKCISVARYSAVHNNDKTVETEEVKFDCTPPIDSLSGAEVGLKSEVCDLIILHMEGDQMGHFKAGKVYDLVFKET